MALYWLQWLGIRQKPPNENKTTHNNNLNKQKKYVTSQNHIKTIFRQTLNLCLYFYQFTITVVTTRSRSSFYLQCWDSQVQEKFRPWLQQVFFKLKLSLLTGHLSNLQTIFLNIKTYVSVTEYFWKWF